MGFVRVMVCGVVWGADMGACAKEEVISRALNRVDVRNRMSGGKGTGCVTQRA